MSRWLGIVGATSGVVGVAVAALGIYWSEKIQSEVTLAEIMTLQESGGEPISYEESDRCFSTGRCMATFTYLLGLLTFRNKGPVAAQDIKVYARVLGDGCEANVPGYPAGMQSIGWEPYAGSGDKFSVGLYTIYTTALAETQTVDYCVVRRGSLPYVWEYTKGTITIGPGMGTPSPIQGLGKLDALPVTYNTNSEAGKTLSPESTCTKISYGPTRLCRPLSVTHEQTSSPEGKALFLDVMENLLRQGEADDPASRKVRLPRDSMSNIASE